MNCRRASRGQRRNRRGGDSELLCCLEATCTLRRHQKSIAGSHRTPGGVSQPMDTNQWAPTNYTIRSCASMVSTLLQHHAMHRKLVRELPTVFYLTPLTLPCFHSVISEPGSQGMLSSSTLYNEQAYISNRLVLLDL